METHAGNQLLQLHSVFRVKGVLDATPYVALSSILAWRGFLLAKLLLEGGGEYGLAIRTSVFVFVGFSTAPILYTACCFPDFCSQSYLQVGASPAFFFPLCPFFFFLFGACYVAGGEDKNTYLEGYIFMFHWQSR